MTQKCILCESTTQLIHARMADYHYCTHCEFISKDENNIISQQEELRIYNLHHNSIEDPRYVDYFNVFLDDAVLPYANAGKSGLDFGSGPSPVLAQILERNHAYQMDIYDMFYAPVKVYEGKSYDLITSTEVVEHLRNPIAYFELFASLLTPDGILAVMTQFHQNDEAHFLNWHYIRDMSHVSFYTPTTMAWIADKIGLRTLHMNPPRHTTFCLAR